MSVIRYRRAGWEHAQRSLAARDAGNQARPPVKIRDPPDRDGSFEPRQCSSASGGFQGSDEKILGLYTQGMSTRIIEAYLRGLYGVSVGRDPIRRVTDAVMQDAREWQTRPLDDVYPVLFLDALALKIRDGGSVQRRACYVALAMGMDGEREVLGMWFQATEGAKFGMQVLTDLKQRGVRGILIYCVDGLKEFPEAPQTVETCIVHLNPGTRSSTSHAGNTTPW